MGIDCTIFRELVDLSTRFGAGGRSLMLGRQRFEPEPAFAEEYPAALARAGRDDLDALRQPDGYAETLLRGLGLGSAESMDMSAYEGAQILHDLNRPVPEDLHGAFDFILDGGTLEHVFNLPVALENVFHMLAPGGRFVSVNGMNGWVGHGMYQLGPELAWTFWQRGCGCRVLRCAGLSKKPGAHVLEFPDPAEKGVRLRLRGKLPAGRMYLYYEIEKTQGSALRGVALQSDYVEKWSSHEGSKEVAT